MMLIRSDTPEVTRCIASGRARVSRHWPAFIYGFSLNVLILLIAFAVSIIASLRVAAWLGVPVFVAWNLYVLWLVKSSRRNWVIAGCANRVCIRLGVNHPEVIMLEVSEIASMSIRTVRVFLYGPKPKVVQWLVIDPVEGISESVSDHIRPLLGEVDPGKLVNVANEEGRLILGWKWCHPTLRVFLQEIARECPSVLIAPEDCSELDLNGIWRGTSLNLDEQKRRLLVQAERLGFGSDCKRLLCRYKYISFQKAAAYLADVKREEAGTERSTV